MSLKVTVGCDPEVWVRSKKTGRIVSAHDLMPGTKLMPHKVDKGAVQVDGVAAEFNIVPAGTSEEFTGNISTVMTSLQNFVGSDYELVSEPVATFTKDYFKSLPEVNRELGCNPDWNAWTGQINDKPDGDVDFRTAAGHIHIGWGDGMNPTDQNHIDDCRIVVKNLDYYLGMNSLMWDEDKKRRELYGKAGCFRPKPYGVEYRPLSNVWLRSKRLQGWVFKAAQKCLYDIIQKGVRLDENYGDRCVDVINNSVRWWDSDDKKLLELPKILDLGSPPKLPKPGEKDSKMSIGDAIKAVSKQSGESSSRVTDYFKQADGGSSAHVNYINSFLIRQGLEPYFES